MMDQPYGIPPRDVEPHEYASAAFGSIDSDPTAFQSFAPPQARPQAQSNLAWNLPNPDSFHNRNLGGVRYPRDALSQITPSQNTSDITSLAEPFSPQYTTAPFDHHNPSATDAPVESYISPPYTAPTAAAYHQRGSVESQAASPTSQSRPETSGLSQRERNRIAAQKCRRKSKQYQKDLADRARDLANLNKLLSAERLALKDEVFVLKSEVLKHGSCNCSVIDDYIAKTARDLPPPNDSTEDDPTKKPSRVTYPGPSSHGNAVAGYAQPPFT
ncbi:hypothetical protein DL766_001047 [Monosporascus sp. MC13-8B]|uniref:BZIP domain-containing protein n=1 Tax=Monosporascus cannonballus TaxID=155416 RepID=A0ABY0H1Q7_9PEZI|nr:hypothetical protein DL762_006863 [Monosporascus cannonballus]RYP00837.1 hypothetical protein DL763_000562 [Monosporascus cannonballus]RYP38338.1 hypothetical protein DL766_001047 [Monosporascus sp. MC13-8B]